MYVCMYVCMYIYMYVYRGEKGRACYRAISKRIIGLYQSR